MPKQIQSAFLIKPLDVILCSRSRHDLYTSSKAPGWHIDGGLDYLKYSIAEGYSQSDIEFLNLFEDSPIEDFYYKSCWGVYVKNKENSILELEYKLIKDLSLEYIEKLLSSNYAIYIQEKLILVFQYWKTKKSEELDGTIS